VADGESIAEVLTLAERGWRLLPCAERGKIPLIKDWTRRASCDSEAIRSWAQRHPGCNWGLATGPESKVWALDVDGEPGRESLNSLVAQYGEAWTRTITVQTSKGMHLYFSYPSNGAIRNSASKLATGLDTRGDGGYVLVPPSIHPSGATYQWTTPLNGQPPASTPEWLFQLIASPQRPAVRASDVGALYTGSRNDGLFRVGCYLRRKGFELDQIEFELLDHNTRRCKPPLPDEDIYKIARQAAAYPIGGPDPLEAAWNSVQGKTFSSNYAKFIALAAELQAARPDHPIVLPVNRIGTLFDLHRTAIGCFRRQAVKDGVLELAEAYVAKRRAACYKFLGKLEEQLPKLSLSSPYGLGRVQQNTQQLPIERVAVITHRESPAVAHRESPLTHRESLRRCLACGSHALYRELDGTITCQSCSALTSEVN
jgi:hypothetical protein